MTTTRSLFCDAVTAGWISRNWHILKSLRLICSSCLACLAESCGGRTGGCRSRPCAPWRSTPCSSVSEFVLADHARAARAASCFSAEASERAFGHLAAGAAGLTDGVGRRVGPVGGPLDVGGDGDRGDQGQGERQAQGSLHGPQPRKRRRPVHAGSAIRGGARTAQDEPQRGDRGRHHDRAGDQHAGELDAVGHHAGRLVEDEAQPAEHRDHRTFPPTLHGRNSR